MGVRGVNRREESVGVGGVNMSGRSQLEEEITSHLFLALETCDRIYT